MAFSVFDQKTLVNTEVAGDQSDPSIAALLDGGFILVWSSGGNQDGSGLGIFGQRYSSTGQPVGAEFQVNSYVEDDQFAPSVVGMSDGSYFVTWWSEGQDGAFLDAYGRIFEPDGTPRTDAFQVHPEIAQNQAVTDDEPAPFAIAPMGDEGAVISWLSRKDPENIAIVAQRFDLNGTPTGDEFEVNSGPVWNPSQDEIDQPQVSLAELPGIGFVVLWNAEDGGVLARRFAYDGTALGDEFWAGGDYWFWHSVTGFDDGGFVVVSGEDFFLGAYFIRFRRFDAEGTVTQSESEIYYDIASGDALGPTTVETMPDGGFLLAFQREPQEGWDSEADRTEELVYQRYPKVLDPERWINTIVNETISVEPSATVDLSPPVVATLNDGSFVIVWTSDDDGDGQGLFGKRFAPEIYGTFGDDEVIDAIGANRVYGLDGNDTLYGQDGSDTIRGDDGNDVIAGGIDADSLEGNYGEDRISGDAGDDVIRGGRGRDDISGGVGADTLSGEYGWLQRDLHSGQSYRLYQAALGRDPDHFGQAYWTQALASAHISLEQAATGFINSREFQVRYGETDNAQFVTLLYSNALDRDPDPEGFESWLTALEAGMSREDVLIGFSESIEFVSKTHVAALEFATEAQQGSFTGQVYRLYWAALARDPDPDGLYGWTENLAFGQSFLETAAGFVNSPEFAAIYSETDDAEFVTLLYANVLEREPDAEGFEDWLAALNSGESRQAVVLGFSESPEFVKKAASEITDFMRSDAATDHSDNIEGVTGPDILVGGIGADVFVFDAVSSIEATVVDLEPWDIVELKKTLFNNVTEVFDYLSEHGGNTMLDYGDATVLFQGIQLSEIAVADQFVLT